MCAPTALILALLCVAAAISCAAQATVIEPSQFDLGSRCEAFSSANVNCQGVVPVGTLIYLNSSTTQASADAFATTQATLISVVRNLDSVCADALYPWMCSLVFRPCLWQNYSTSNGIQSFAVPNLTCAALCDSVNSKCAVVSQQFNQPPQLCDPALAYNFTDVGDGIFEPTCTPGWTASNASSCPTQCLRPDLQDPDNCCKLRCPIGRALYGPTKWRALVATEVAIAYIAFFATLFTVVVFSINPAARKFPGVVIIVQGLALLVEGLGAMITSFYGMKELHCTNRHPVACNAQTFMLALGSQTALTYWTVVNALTCLSLYVRYPVKETMEKYKWWLVTAMVYPILSVALTAWSSSKEAGKPPDRTGPFYGLGITPICFGGFDSIRNFYIIWSVIFICLGTIMWLLSVGQIVHLHIIGLRQGTGGIKLRGYLSIILYQLFVLCTAGLFCILFFMSYRELGGHPSNFETDLLNYLSGTSDKKPDGQYGLIFGQVFLISFVSLFYALVFGFHPINFEFAKSQYRRWRLRSTTTTSASSSQDMYTFTRGDGQSAF